MPVTLLDLVTTRDEPVVWISRVLLLSSIRPLEIIREIKLGRGLNIVWGVDENDGETDEVIVSGHGVGKTSFCRLLRYCLGESAFANKSARERIRDTFPQGYVAAEVHIGGEEWAVARPIGRSPQHYAARNASIENMLESKEGRTKYDEFKQVIEDTALAELTAGMTIHTRQPIKWDHVLAWCARYQSIWQWRSPRSDSETPAFNRPREDGLFLIRTILGLLSGEEVKLQEQLDKIEKESSENEKKIAEARREPEYWTNRLAQKLASIMGLEPEQLESEKEETLFDVRVQEGEFRQKIETNVKGIDEKISTLDTRIIDLSAKINDLDQSLETHRGFLRLSQLAANELTKGVEEREKEKQELISNLDLMCKMGRISFKDCSHVQERIKILSYRDAVDDKKDAETAKKKEEEVKRTESEIKALEKQRADLDRNLQSLRNERRALEKERGSLLRRIEQASSIASELQQWRAIRNGKEPNTKLADLQEKEKTLNTSKDQLKTELSQLLTKHEEHLEELRKVFDGMVKQVVYPEYRGNITFKDGELEFQITHGTTLAGEAIDTLAVLLTDVCALVMGTIGKGCHPGFLVHDSPREADLGPRIYRSYLRSMARLQEQYLRSASPPFQYIITTTTSPPPELQDEGVFKAPFMRQEH
ncbi:MAG: hypothetical protein JRI80_09565 [Deltaproteobacteria bacterium]|nr:hypothetical protein [Deltaproteobacteria bacterium]